MRRVSVRVFEGGCRSQAPSCRLVPVNLTEDP